MANVELSLSETFHKHKRNLVLLCSAITILRIASPDKLKLPFVGADVDLPSSVAFVLLALALIYMFSQYYIEYKTMLARHSSVVVENSNRTVDEVINRHLAIMEGWIDSIKLSGTNENSTKVVASINSDQLSAIVEKYKIDIDHSLAKGFAERRDLQGAVAASDSDVRINKAIDQLKGHFDSSIKRSTDTVIGALGSLDYHIQALAPYQASLEEKLSQYNATYQQIASDFKKLSSSIGSAQRVGFRWIDGYLVIAFALLSLGACATGALGWWIKPPAPIAAPQTSIPLPPASTKG